MGAEAAESWLRRGLALAQCHRWRGALTCYLHAAAEAPESAEAHFRCAATLDALGREGEAVPAYRRALGLGLEARLAAPAWAWLGSSLRKTGRPAEALECLGQAARCGYPAAPLAAWSGLALLALGRAGEALAAVDRALAEAPGEAEFWRCRGRVLRAMHRGREAAEAYARAREAVAACGG